VLLPQATELDKAGKQIQEILTSDRIRSIVTLIPHEWLTSGSFTESPDKVRNVYSQFLETRMANSDIFVKEANHARSSLI
jgi:hypothetical protein